MTVLLRSRVRFSPALRGIIGFPLLLLGACTVGIDDRPVPPEDIPGAAYQAPAADYGAPAESAAPVIQAAAPAYSAAPESGEGMVWQTGAQPAVQRSALSAPGEISSGSSLGEEVTSLGEEPAVAEEGASASGESEASEQPAEAAAVAPADTHTFRLAPFVGLDAGAAAPLRNALEAEAEQNGYNLGGGKDALVLKGYLSSMEDNGSTVLIYVWDVYDAAGARLTRIDGQQKLPAGTQTEPLTLDEQAAEKLAARTIAALARWRPEASG